MTHATNSETKTAARKTTSIAKTALMATAALGLGALGWAAAAQDQAGDPSPIDPLAAEEALGDAPEADGFRGDGRRGRAARAMARFDRLDRDGDGRVTQEEIDATRTERFAAMDTSGDGLVDPTELATFWMTERARRMIERRDTDGDGMMSPDEQPRRGQRLARFDLDEDGAVTRTEFRLGLAQMRGRGDRGHGPRWRRDGGAGYRGGHGGSYER